MNSEGWKAYTVHHFVSRGEAELKTGPFGTQLHASDYVEEGIPVINVRNIGFGGIREEKLEFISEETAQRLASHLLLANDIVFGRKGAVERHVLIKQKYVRWFQGSDCLRLRWKSPSVDPQFISYYLLTEDHKRWMANQCSHGSTMASLNQDIIARIPLSLPPLSIQRKIASILSAYDDLIENNTRRIAILEEMARMLYQEWFVKFRFPGHEHIGTIPSGWEVKYIGDIIDVLGGGTPSTQNKAYWDDGDILWYSPTDLTSAGTLFVLDSAKKITSLGLRSSSARLFPAYSVMMTSRATIGVIAINTQPASTNQGFITCIPNDTLSAHQIYHWLLDNQEKIIGLASGATFKEINKATFRQLTIIVPDKVISQQFNNIVFPIYKQVENLIKRNANLRRTRDLLLPKLISGEIDVSSWVSDEEILASDVGGTREIEPAQPIDVVATQQGMLWE